MRVDDVVPQAAASTGSGVAADDLARCIVRLHQCFDHLQLVQGDDEERVTLWLREPSRGCRLLVRVSRRHRIHGEVGALHHDREDVRGTPPERVRRMGGLLEQRPSAAVQLLGLFKMVACMSVSNVDTRPSSRVGTVI